MPPCSAVVKCCGQLLLVEHLARRALNAQQRQGLVLPAG